MHLIVLVGATLACPASAYDLGKATKGTSEAVYHSSHDLFAVERCILTSDGPPAPIVYRTPDKPDESLIYYSPGIGKPIVYKLTRDAGGTTVTIYNGTKWKDRVEACTTGG